MTIAEGREAGGAREIEGCMRPARGVGRWALPLCVLGSLLLYCALFLLLRAPSFRLSGTGVLRRWPALRELSDLLTPQSLLSAGWRSSQAAVHEYVYLAVAVALVALWGTALWLLRPGAGRSLRLPVILAVAALLSVPLFVLPGMFSGDIYLYMFYGRMIARYGANPIVLAPNAFPADPHLLWVYWTWLPSSYGPVWLMLSGALSAFAGDGQWMNLFTYKLAPLVIHLLTAVALWLLLRQTRPRWAAWGAVFYAWNPLVLFETVGSGHNDVLVGLFSVLALLAVAHRRWAFGVCFLVAAAMVKLMALVLLPVLIVAWLREAPDARARLRTIGLAAGAALATTLVLYAPLWGGTALLRNVIENPAAREYQNSLWELLYLRVIRPGFNPMNAIFSSELDVVRNGLFGVALLVLLWRLWRGADLLDTMVWTWFAYFLCAGWMWPWYFVQLLPLAAVRGWGRSAAVGAALTLGGMLFWLGWPEPALPAAPYFFDYRSVLLFAPAMLVAVWPSGGLPRVLGAPRRRAEAAS